MEIKWQLVKRAVRKNDTKSEVPFKRGEIQSFKSNIKKRDADEINREK